MRNHQIGDNVAVQIVLEGQRTIVIPMIISELYSDGDYRVLILPENIDPQPMSVKGLRVRPIRLLRI